MAIIKKPVVHQFPRAYATEFGVNEAIILKWLAHKTRKSKNYRDGKAWMYNPISKIAEQFPYLSRSSVAGSLKNLQTTGLVLTGNYNKWKQDKTKWYHVPQPHLDAVEQDLINFDILEAGEHGVPSAILLQNLRYWLQKQLKKKVTEPTQEMSPTSLSRLMLFLSKSTVKRALTELTAKGIIVKAHATKPLYTFPHLLESAGEIHPK